MDTGQLIFISIFAAFALGMLAQGLLMLPHRRIIKQYEQRKTQRVRPRPRRHYDDEYYDD